MTTSIRSRDRALRTVHALSFLATSGTVVATLGVAAVLAPAEEGTQQPAPAADSRTQALAPPSTPPRAAGDDRADRADRDDRDGRRKGRDREDRQQQPAQPAQPAPPPAPQTSGS